VTGDELRLLIAELERQLIYLRAGLDPETEEPLQEEDEEEADGDDQG